MKKYKITKLKIPVQDEKFSINYKYKVEERKYFLFFPYYTIIDYTTAVWVALETIREKHNEYETIKIIIKE